MKDVSAAEIAWSSNGKYLACSAIGRSPDGDRGAPGQENIANGVVIAVNVWSVTDGQKICQLPFGDDSPTGLCFSPDNASLLTSGFEGGITLWDIGSGKRIRSLSENISKKVNAVTMTPDWSKILIGRLLTGEADKWRIDLCGFESEECTLLTKGATGGVWRMIVSPSGKYLLFSGPGLPAQLWDIDSKKPVRRFEQGISRFHAIAFSLDSKYFVHVNEKGTPCLRFVEINGEVMRFEYESPAMDAVLTPDGQSMVTCHQDGTIIQWE